MYWFIWLLFFITCFSFFLIFVFSGVFSEICRVKSKCHAIKAESYVFITTYWAAFSKMWNARNSNAIKCFTLRIWSIYLQVKKAGDLRWKSARSSASIAILLVLTLSTKNGQFGFNRLCTSSGSPVTDDTSYENPQKHTYICDQRQYKKIQL